MKFFTKKSITVAVFASCCLSGFFVAAKTEDDALLVKRQEALRRWKKSIESEKKALKELQKDKRYTTVAVYDNLGALLNAVAVSGFSLDLSTMHQVQRMEEKREGGLRLKRPITEKRLILDAIGKSLQAVVEWVKEGKTLKTNVLRRENIAALSAKNKEFFDVHIPELVQQLVLLIETLSDLWVNSRHVYKNKRLEIGDERIDEKHQKNLAQWKSLEASARKTFATIAKDCSVLAKKFAPKISDYYETAQVKMFLSLKMQVAAEIAEILVAQMVAS